LPQRALFLCFQELRYRLHGGEKQDVVASLTGCEPQGD
jgi:hypothetical protein